MNGAVEFPLDLAELSFRAAGESLVRRSILPSGVRILSEHVPGSRSLTIGYWVAVGSRDEQPGHIGSTHLLEQSRRHPSAEDGVEHAHRDAAVV